MMMMIMTKTKYQIFIWDFVCRDLFRTPQIRWQNKNLSVTNLRTTDGLTNGSDGTENSHTWQCEPLQSNNGRCSCEMEIERSKFAINTGFHAQQFSFDRKYFSTELRKLVERNSLCSNFRSVTTIIVITINRYIMRRARWQERRIFYYYYYII